MNQSTNTSVTPFDWLIDRIRVLIREELAMANNAVTGGITDKARAADSGRSRRSDERQSSVDLSSCGRATIHALSIERIFGFLKPVYAVGWQQKARWYLSREINRHKRKAKGWNRA
jgi:hypothetical protein